MESNPQKEMILIVDDCEMNRSILADMLRDEYEIIEDGNGGSQSYFNAESAEVPLSAAVADAKNKERKGGNNI